MNMPGGFLLLVEDEQILQKNIQRMLERENYAVKTASTLAEARSIIKDTPPRGIILDIQLPDGSGLDFLVELRRKSDIPVLILTALGAREDINRGLKSGSDEYLTKPFDREELFLRLDNILRRAESVPESIDYGDFKLNPTSGKAYLNGEEMLLSPKEYAVLQLLVQNPEEKKSAEYLYEKAWGYEACEKDKSIKRNIRKTVSTLREKMTGSEYTVALSDRNGYSLERK